MNNLQNALGRNLVFTAKALRAAFEETLAQNGGSLGTFSKGRMVPEFEQAAFSLPVGQLSEPIKTKFGYHIIRVDSKTEKSFDDVKADLEKQMKPQMAQQAVQDIRKQTQTTLDDNYFGTK